MPTIHDRIQYLATQLTPNFYYGRKSDINIQADNFAFPAICLIEPDDIGFVFDTLTGNIKDTDNCFIQFIDIHEMGNQAPDRLTAINTMRGLAAQFVNLVANDDGVDSIEFVTQNGVINVRGTLIVDGYDANVVGIEINLPLRLTYPLPLC